MRHNHVDPVIPSAQDAIRAGEARAAIGAGQEVAMRDLPPVVARLLMDILRQTEAGNAVTLVPVEAEITTQQAANLLNVSRPFLIRLIDNGILPGRMVGKHRRLPLREVLVYKADQFAKREQALDEIAALGQQFGLP
jgi:excisionase family DNA binding protein